MRRDSVSQPPVVVALRNPLSKALVAGSRRCSRRRDLCADKGRMLEASCRTFASAFDRRSDRIGKRISECHKLARLMSPCRDEGYDGCCLKQVDSYADGRNIHRPVMQVQVLAQVDEWLPPFSAVEAAASRTFHRF